MLIAVLMMRGSSQPLSDGIGPPLEVVQLRETEGAATRGTAVPTAIRSGALAHVMKRLRRELPWSG